jgi:hypothetical protein
MAHKFKKGQWRPVKEPGSETKRAQAHGRSLHQQAEIDSHSPDKRIRGKGIFALNAQAHKFRHAGKRKTKTESAAKTRTGKSSRKKSVIYKGA